MQELNFNIRDFIKVNRIDPHRTHWPVRCPFDLNFSSHSLTADQKSAISGTGIYLITKLPEMEVVYLGLFKPTNGDIISLRWGRHLQTITWRGLRIGLGPTPKNRKPLAVERRMKNLLTAATRPDLKEVIQAAYDHDRAALYTSTGNDTTPNRLRFANEHWEQFSTATAHSVLEHFSFRLLRSRPAVDQEAAAIEIIRIENLLRAQYKLVCNSDYKHPQHQELRKRNTVPGLVAAVRQTMIDVTGDPPTHCVTLNP